MPGPPPIPPSADSAASSPPSDPDNVVLCLLAADEEEEGDAALQIHFTLIQAFCCENDINILRVSNPARLAQLLLPDGGPEPPTDLHCVLVTVSPSVMTQCQRPGEVPEAEPSAKASAISPGPNVLLFKWISCSTSIFPTFYPESPRLPMEGSSAESADVLLPGESLHGSVGAGDQPPRAVTASQTSPNHFFNPLLRN